MKFWFRTVILVLFSCSASAQQELFDAVRQNDLNKAKRTISTLGTNNINMKIPSGITVLHLASSMNRLDIAKYLVENGADINARTDNGFTPLHWAARHDSAEIASLLLKNGADINAKANNGITPLHWAANRNATNMIKFLLLSNADYKQRSSSGYDALNWASKAESTDAENILAYILISDDIRKEDEKAMEEAKKDISLAKKIDAQMDPIEAEVLSTIPEIPKTNKPPEVIMEPVNPKVQPGTYLNVPIGASEELSFVWIDGINIWVGKTEIDNGQYKRFKYDHNSKFIDNFTLDNKDQPVVYVSWDDANEFCKWLNNKYNESIPDNYEFRLPNEVEWIVFARCNSDKKYPWGDSWPPKYGNFADRATADNISDLSTIHNYNDQFPVTADVTLCGTNEWGICGVSGNVWEWCDNWYDKKKQYKARRGGAWDTENKTMLETMYRGFDKPDVKADNIGFRVIVAPKR